MPDDTRLKIAHLHEYPQFVNTVAQWIHDEWWTGAPGYTPETVAARLREASTPGRIPLTLVGLMDEMPVGTVSLWVHDDDTPPELTPWLAALYVLPQERGRGMGTRLTLRLLDEARRLRVRTLYLSTPIPDFYRRLGAEIHSRVGGDRWIMRLGVGP